MGLAFAVILLMVPPGRIASAIATAASVAVVVGIVAGVRRHRPNSPAGWYLLAAACPISALSEGVQIFGVAPGVVSATDGIATAASLLLGGIGIAVLARRRGRAEWNPRTLLDYSVIVVAGSVFTFDVFISSVAQVGFQQAASLIGCIAAIGVFTLVARMLSNKQGTFASRSLACVVVFAVTSGALSAFGTTTHSLPAVFQVLTEYFIAMAALHPTMMRLSESVESRIQRFTLLRAAIAASALLVTTADAAVQMYRMSNTVNTIWLISSFAIALAVSMRVRMLLVERDEARCHEEEKNAVLRVLTRAGEKLSSAMSTEDAISTAVALANEVVLGGVEFLSHAPGAADDADHLRVGVVTDSQAYGVIVARIADARSSRANSKEFLGQLVNMLTMSLLRIEVEDDLRRSQKLEAVGRLTEGLAHELNTPLQYLQSNVEYIHKAFDCAIGHVSQDVIDSDDELSFMQNDMQAAVEQTLDGLQRAADIVSAMRTVGEVKATDVEVVDVNRLVVSVLTLARSRLSGVGEVLQTLSATHAASCNTSELSEVFMIVLTNAIDEVLRVHGEANAESVIRITTYDVDGAVGIDIGDNGDGISSAASERIWDQFFTTKDVGRGAGLGLSVARSLVRQMQGKITFSTDASGTTFTILLPAAS